MISHRRRYIQINACLVAGALIENRCVAWTACIRVPSASQRTVNGIRSSTCLSAADGNQRNGDDDLQSLLNRGNPEESAGISSLWEDNSEEGILLDTDTYLNADSYLQDDGTLNLDGNDPRQQKITNPLYQHTAAQLLNVPMYTIEDDAVTTPGRQPTDDELLYQAVANIETISQRTDSEDLHHQVFAEEQGYLEQSEEFRKSLSTLYDDDVETATAKARREAIESYNDDILKKLLEEVDEMEKLAPTKEEAMKQAKTKSSLNEMYCGKCGCKVTPDVIERFEMMKEAYKEESNEPRMKKVEFLCDVCHAEQLRSVDEARIRLGVGNYGDASSATMWDKKKYKPRRDDQRFKRREARSGVDTASMFQMPKESRMTDFDVEIAKRELETREAGNIDVPQRITSRTRELGSRELERRMQKQQKSELTRIVEEQTPIKKYTSTIEEAPVSSDTDDEWTRVIDEKSQRTLFWNKATGEMRKTPPGS